MQLPDLPLHEWEKTKMTLHLFMQIVGKIKLKCMPRKNHWWNITLQVNAKGITTGAMPYKNGCMEIQFNLMRHQVEISASEGETEHFDLHETLSVADFYKTLFSRLSKLGIQVKIINKPYSLPDVNPITTSFDKITEHATYQKDYVERFWKILLWVHTVFTEFGGRFYGKTSPVQLFWHHLDLVITRFSDKKIPSSPGMRNADKDAYSHEVISFGFWAGDENVPGPAFYSYTFPAPADLDKQLLQPTTATWKNNNGSPMALVMYDDLRKEEDPRKGLLDFLESAYISGASLAGWNVEQMRVPRVQDL